MCYPARPNQKYRCDCHMMARNSKPFDGEAADRRAREASRLNAALCEQGRWLAMSKKGKAKARARHRAMAAHPSNFMRGDR